MSPENHDKRMTLRILLSDFPREDWNAKVEDRLLQDFSPTLPMPRLPRRLLTYLILNPLIRVIDGDNNASCEDYHTPMLREVLRLRSSRNNDYAEKRCKPRFLLRIDDFPPAGPKKRVRYDSIHEKFAEFQDILIDEDLSYLLGVTPFIASDLVDDDYTTRTLSRDEIEGIERTVTHRGEIALHGFTHHSNTRPSKGVSERLTSFTRPKLASEVVALLPSELEARIKMSLAELERMGIRPEVFIPPFNAIDAEAIRVLRKYFKCLCGGPESLYFLGYRFSPSYIHGCLYLPSYSPAHGRAKDIVHFINKLHIHENIIIPITLHWMWEMRDSFSYVKVLAGLLKDNTLPWSAFHEWSRRCSSSSERSRNG